MQFKQTRSHDLEMAQEAIVEEQVNVFVNGVSLTMNALDSLISIENMFCCNFNSNFCYNSDMNSSDNSNIRFHMRFVSNGRLLFPALSLKFNGIRDGDSIIAIGPKEFYQTQSDTMSNTEISNNNNNYSNNNNKKNFAPQKFRERFEKNWANKFVDPESIYEQLRDATDPKTAAESARLSDLFKMRVENNVATYRKVCNKFVDDHNVLGANKKPLVTVIPEKSYSPSTEFLPELWIHNAPSPNNGTARAAVY